MNVQFRYSLYLNFTKTLNMKLTSKIDKFNPCSKGLHMSGSKM